MTEKKPRVWGSWWAVVMLVWVAGCAGGGAGGGKSDSAQVDTLPSGRVRVVNAGPEWSAKDAWTATEDLRIGVQEGSGPDAFGQIAAVKVDKQGRIYVLDFMSQDIRVFEADGSYSHTIGRKGKGPGEFMSAAGLNWGPDGNLWVWDTGGRFSIFKTDGTYVGSRPRKVRGVVYPWRGQFDTDGSLIDWGLEYPGLTFAPGARPPTRLIYYPVRFSGDFAVGDTLPSLEFDFQLDPDRKPMIFGENLTTYLDRSGAIWFARTKTFTLYRRTLEGDTTLEFSIDANPVPVTDHDVDSVRAVYGEQGRPQDVPEPQRFAKSKPVIRRIFGDDAGHIFVLGQQVGLPPGTYMDVFEDDGHYLGRVDLPARVNFPYPPPTVVAGNLYYVTPDSLGVEYVVRVRLTEPLEEAS